MDAKTLALSQIEEVGYSLDKTLEGISGDQWDAKATDETMTPREIVTHLADCYVATQKSAAGEEPAWGSTVLSDDATEAVKQMKEHRAAAVASLEPIPAEKAAHLASSFIILHDAYHVGQLASIRLKNEGWDPYSIYRM